MIEWCVDIQMYSACSVYPITVLVVIQLGPHLIESLKNKPKTFEDASGPPCSGAVQVGYTSFAMTLSLDLSQVLTMQGGQDTVTVAVKVIVTA